MIAISGRTIGRAGRWDASSFRRFGRIPPKLRGAALRRASGRAWKAMGATDEQVGAALGIDRRNAARRRAGETGPFAGVVEEVYQMEAAGISTYALTAHLRSLAMQARLEDVPTEDLLTRLDQLQAEETDANGAMDATQMRYALRAEVCPTEFRERAARQAAISEEIVAILDELDARREG